MKVSSFQVYESNLKRQMPDSIAKFDQHGNECQVKKISQLEQSISMDQRSSNKTYVDKIYEKNKQMHYKFNKQNLKGSSERQIQSTRTIPLTYIKEVNKPLFQASGVRSNYELPPPAQFGSEAYKDVFQKVDTIDFTKISNNFSQVSKDRSSRNRTMLSQQQLKQPHSNVFFSRRDNQEAKNIYHTSSQSQLTWIQPYPLLNK